MTDAQKVSDWVRFYEIAHPSYKPFALAACLRNDGDKILAAVVKKLGLTVEKLVEDMGK